MIDPLFVTSKCSRPVKEVTEKNTLLAYTLLVCNKLLRRECLWVLGNHLLFSPKHKMFTHWGTYGFSLVFIVIIHLENRSFLCCLKDFPVYTVYRGVYKP